MTISPITGGYNDGAVSQVARDSSIGGLGKDAFLKLLVAQLKYQDPSNPADTNQMMAQTAQLTMVEKLTALAQQGADQLASTRAAEAGQLVGRDVTFDDANGSTRTGTVTAARLLPTGPVLVVDGLDVALSAVTQITNPSGRAGSSTTGTDAASTDPAAAGGTA
jgi:flagellar basal-body rod modification protein FlgD